MIAKRLTCMLQYWKDKYPPLVIQWTEELTVLSTYEHIAYIQPLHTDTFLDIWKSFIEAVADTVLFSIASIFSFLLKIITTLLLILLYFFLRYHVSYFVLNFLTIKYLFFKKNPTVQDKFLEIIIPEKKKETSVSILILVEAVIYAIQ